MRSALTVAGSDSSGGAGIQADIKAMTLNGVFATSAVTAITAQNTCGVRAVQPVSEELLAQQIDAIFEDIRPDAVKVGMMPTVELAHITAERLAAHGAERVIVDPVMVATSGDCLADADDATSIADALLPLATLATPNIAEAEVLAQMRIRDQDDMLRAAMAIEASYDCGVLVKGGHATDDADDLLLIDGNPLWLRAPRIDNPNSHGTGCTLSSAIAAHLAQGKSLALAVRAAKDYVRGALAAGLDLGQGPGPLDHAFALRHDR